MGSTYLELTNRVLRRLNEVELDSSTFASARGIHAAAKDAVLDTVQDINSQKFEWPFNSAIGTQILTVGQEEYSWPADLRSPDWESFYIEKSIPLNINTKRLIPVNKNEWFRSSRDLDYDSGSDGRNIPQYVFESDSDGFGVTPSPNAAYTVKFTYWINTISLDLYSDTTTIPSEYDYVITDGAIRLLYMFLDNDERAAVANETYKKGLANMAFILTPKDFYAWDHRVTRTNYRSNRMFTYS